MTHPGRDGKQRTNSIKPVCQLGKIDFRVAAAVIALLPASAPCHALTWTFRLNIQSTALGARYLWPQSRPVHRRTRLPPVPAGTSGSTGLMAPTPQERG